MARNFLLTLLFVLVGTLTYAQTSVAGKITDAETGEDLIGANIKLFKDGVFKTGASTDFDGNYSIDTDPGTYDVEVSYVGYPPNKITGVVVNASQANKLDIQLGGGDTGTGIDLDVVVVTEYKVPLIEQDNTTQGGIVTSEQIRNLPTKSISALAATTAGLSQADEGDAVSIRGSRSNATDYYIDGIRVSGSLIPESEIEQMQVITGGIEAQYGDVTGGIISITTKGPSGKFSGGVEVETSQYLDDYGYNLANVNLSGPIIKRKTTGESILGFRISGRYRAQEDDDPAATSVWKVKDEALQTLFANPVGTIGNTRIPAAEFLTNDDVDEFGFRQDEKRERLDFTAKLDARLNNSIDVTLSGSYVDSKNRFSPANSWKVFNSYRNPTNNFNSYRGNFRFRHRLGKAASYDAADTERKSSLIQNAQYSVTLGYEKTNSNTSDALNGENIFDYGYVGKFDYDYQPAIGVTDWTGGVLIPGTTTRIGHIDNRELFTGYTPGTINPVLANYNLGADVDNENDLNVFNGFTVGTVTSAWGLHTNVGIPYNSISKGESDLYTLNVTSSFDLLPSGSEKGRHKVQVGFIYEQRFSRSWNIAPYGIWNIARQQANRHILGVDTSSVIGSMLQNIPGLGEVEVPLFNTFITEFPGLTFYEEVRAVAFPNMSLEESLHEWVNIDGLDPSQLRLDMFSPQELTDQNLIGYSGYDYLGNKSSNDITFDDFFTAKDAQGIRSFPVAANQPIYGAGYIQDKFTFKDIIFRLGVRIDYFDANTKVLKDPFSLYEVMSANEFYDQVGGERPAGVEDDFSVYVEGENSNVVKAFRNDEQWYFANGTVANDGNIIFGGQVVTPKIKDPSANIKNDGFDTSLSFEDYEPQINVMPRMAFSFPISDAANFFAHYDILVQRPPSNNFVSALGYYYFNERTPTNNPNLKPERTIDYEVGFQQKLSNSSALKISAYYKEMRDMIQARTYLYIPSPINEYESFGNLDFGTVKGFSFQYDLRRTGNVSLTANYTLQFADGTGSDANSQRGISQRGNLRTLFPLNFDERHRIVTSVDYRYGTGKKYNGPALFGKDVLANFGVNLQAIAVSGRPYTATVTPTQLGGTSTEGAINGARLPWTFSLNLRADKSFVLSKSAKFPLNLNVYLRVQNLLDTRNVVGVYTATGSPTDSGYLNSTFGRDALEQVESSGKSIEAYLSSYQWRLLNPSNFTLPRRIFLGAIFEF